MASTCCSIICSIILWLLGVCLFVTSVVFDWGNFIELLENYQKSNSTENSTGNSTGNSTTGKSTTGNSTIGNSTGIESCDLALDKYHWIFMSFVILKMIFGIFEYASGGLSLCKKNEKNNRYDTASLIFNILTTLFQTLDLLLLVLFSYHCVADDEINRVRALISYEKDDFVAGISGTVGLIFNLVIKKNTVTIFKAFIDIISECCGKEKRYRESAGLQDPSKHHIVLTWISVLFIFVCIGLAIALARKL